MRINSAAQLAAVILLAVTLAAHSATATERVALLEPLADGQIATLVEKLSHELSGSFKMLDRSLTRSAYESLSVVNAFNMTTAEARSVAAVTGSTHFLVVRSAVQRRASLDKPSYYEAYAALFLVDGRSGRLIRFILASEEAASAEDAENSLLKKASGTAAAITSAIRNFSVTPRPSSFEEVPAVGSAAARGLRTPVPFRRVRPEYTSEAYLYGIAATVDIEVDIGPSGTIEATRIERWAGFGLDESVEQTVRSMQWRAAERDGRFLPMRVLLRYNFTKIEKDGAN